MTVHLFTGHNIAETTEMGPHVSGYVLEHGEIFGNTASSGRQEYRKAMPMGGVLEVTDKRGKSFEFGCSAVNGCYWVPCPSNTYLRSSMHVPCGDLHRHGIQQLSLSRAYLGRNRGAIQTRY